MSNFVALLTMAVVSLAYYWWFLPSGRRATGQSIASGKPRAFSALNVLRGSCFVALYSLTLLLALRFGARVDPGTWVPWSTILNDVFNGGLIWLGGYIVVVFAACASLVRIVADETGGEHEGRVIVFTRTVSWLGIGLATLLSLYGFYCAIVFQRLPA